MDQLAPRMLRRAFGAFPSGVVSVCALDERGAPAGMVVSTFIPVSLEPPLVAFAMRVTSKTWPVLRDRPVLGLSVLSTEYQHAARQLSAVDGDRFAGLDVVASTRGALYLSSASVQFECVVDQEIQAGDHIIVTLLIEDIIVADDETDPLVFHHSRFVTTSPLPNPELASA